jgi:hypothetical protein
MSAQPAYQNNTSEQYAFYRRRDFSNLKAMQNLIFDAIAQETREHNPSFKFSPRVSAFISALQSAHGGGRVIQEPFMRSHETVARYMQIGGSKSAKEAAVRRLINKLESDQHETTYQLIAVTRGGKPTGERDAHGQDIFSATEYVDFLLPVADEAVQRARESEIWRGNKDTGIKPHPGKAIAAQVAWALAQLPRVHPSEAPAPPVPRLMPLDQYAQLREEKIFDSIESAADEIEKRGGDAFEWLDRFEMQLRRVAQSRRKTYRARNDFAVLDDEDVERSGNASMSNTFSSATAPESAAVTLSPNAADLPKAPETAPAEDTPPPTKVLPPPLVKHNKNNGLENDFLQTMISAALAYAAEGYAVFPLHTVQADGACTCLCGKKCREAKKHVCGANCENKGKHPRTPKGCLDASRDPAQIKRWWQRWPQANIGIATGEASACVVLDIDPRHGGGAGLAELRERIAIPETLAIETGRGGAHLYFTYEGADIKNSAGKLGEGLDVRGQGGYVVAPPSLHQSGNRYRISNDARVAPLPEALKDLMLAPPAPVSNVSQFRSRAGQGIGGACFAQGERNNSLFKVGCAIWGHGEAEHLPDLHGRMLDVNARRCSPPLDDAEVAQLAANIAARYVRGVPVNNPVMSDAIEASLPQSKMERDIEERGGTAHYF